MKSYMSFIGEYIRENGSISSDTYYTLKSAWTAMVESVSDAKECVTKIRDLQKKMKGASENEEKEYIEQISQLSAKFSDLKEDIPDDKMKDYEALEAELSDLLGKVDDSKKST